MLQNLLLNNDQFQNRDQRHKIYGDSFVEIAGKFAF